MSGAAKAKIIWGILIAIIVLWIAGALWLDAIIAAGIRTVGSAVVGTKVNVTSVSLKIFSGKLDVKGFTIANPDGFHAERLLAVDRFFIDLDTMSIFSSKIMINQLELSGLHLDYEPSLAGKSNLDVILSNITSEDRDAANRRKNTEADRDTQRQVVIRKLLVRDTALSVSSSALRSTLRLDLPPLEMDNVGGGKSIAAATEEFFARILLEVGKVFDFNKFSGQLKETGEQALQRLDEATGVVGGAVVSTGDSAGNALNDALNQSKNLLRVIPGAGK